MKKYRCKVCGWIYDEAKGDPDNGIAPGTRFEDLPAEARSYVEFIEDLAHTRVSIIGVGAEREQIINRFWK